jgi:hypothetical protein
MVTPQCLHPLDHIVIAPWFFREAVRMLLVVAATATLTLVLEFHPIQEETTPPRWRNHRVGALPDTTRASKPTVPGKELSGTHL